MITLLAELGAELAVGLDEALNALVLRFRGWRQYRRLYSAAERREHARRLADRGPRGG